MDTIRALFFQNQDAFFYFQKGQGKPSLPLSCALMSVAEYVSISLNILKKARINNCPD